MKTSKKWVRRNKNRTKRSIVGWIDSCKNWYWKIVDEDKREVFEKVRHRMDKLIWAYDYVFERGAIDISFDSFKDILIYKLDTYKCLYPEKKKKRRRFIKRPESGGKYIKKNYHGIKDKEKHEAKQLWRKVSGKERDLRKHNKNGSFRGYKIIREVKHRSWVKQQLYRGNYENLHNRELNRHIIDYW